MTDTITSLNYGQHILFGFLSTSMQSQKGSELTPFELSHIASLVEELTSLEYYEGEAVDAPDVQIMISPQDAFKIFCEWYDENVTYFQEIW